MFENDEETIRASFGTTRELEQEARERGREGGREDQMEGEIFSRSCLSSLTFFFFIPLSFFFLLPSLVLYVWRGAVLEAQKLQLLTRSHPEGRKTVGKVVRIALSKVK